MAIVIPVDTDTSAAESSLDRLKRHAKEAADKVKGSFKGTADGFEDLGDAVGLPVDKIKKLSSAMTLLASPVGIIGVSVAAVTVGFVAAAAAGAALIAGVVKLTESSAKAIPGLEKLAKVSGVDLFTDADADRVLTAAAAIDAVGSSASATGVALSSQLAPYVIEAATQIVALNLALSAWLGNNQGIIDGLVKIGSALINAFLSPLQTAAADLAAFLGTTAALVAVFDEDLAKKLNDTANGLAKWAIAGPVAGSIDLLTSATKGYRAEAEKLVKGQKTVNSETKEAKVATDDLAAGVQALLDSGSIEFFDASALAVSEANAEVDAILANIEKLPGPYSDVLLATEAVTEQTSSWREELDGVVASATNALGAMSSADSALSAVAAAGPWGAFIAGLISFIKDFDESLKSFSDFHMDFTKTLGELPEILMKHLRDTLAESSVAAVEMASKFMTSLAENIGPILDALTGAMPDIVAAFLQSVVNPMVWSRAGYEFVAGVWGSTLRVVARFTGAVDAWWKTFVSGEWAAALKDGAKALKDGIVEGVQAIVDRIKEAFKNLFTIDGGSSSGGGGGSKAKDFLAEVFSLGTKVTKTYGDTPGVVTAGPGGLSAQFAPNDRIAASRTDAGLLAQVLNRVGGTPSSAAASAPSPVYVNWADAHRSFDGFFVRHAALGGQSSAFVNHRTGRRG